jgi:hypothetical protein
MVLLNDVKVSESSRPSPDEIIQTLKLVFNGEVKPYVDKKTKEIESYNHTPQSSVSFVDMIVLFCVILIITLSSVKFKLGQNVTNPYVINILHAILIIILFYIYRKIKG